jgi:hypothetical protein
MSARVLTLAVVLIISASAAAADPPSGDTLPAPREVAPSVTIIPAPPMPTGYWRTSSYAVWQNYAVNNQGVWVPRVAYTPDGAFYLSNGQPYYWATAHPRSWYPSTMATPYRSAP